MTKRSYIVKMNVEEILNATRGKVGNVVDIEKTINDIKNKIQDFSYARDVYKRQEGNSVKRKTKIYVKDGKLYLLDSNMPIVPKNFILDTYNGKEYETCLLYTSRCV